MDNETIFIKLLIVRNQVVWAFKYIAMCFTLVIELICHELATDNHLCLTFELTSPPARVESELK